MKTASNIQLTLFWALTVQANIACAQTWQTVDDFQYVPGATAENFGLAVAPSGIVYACGFASDTNGMHGLVMASPDGGNSWSAPLDDFRTARRLLFSRNGGAR